MVLESRVGADVRGVTSKPLAGRFVTHSRHFGRTHKGRIHATEVHRRSACLKSDGEDLLPANLEVDCKLLGNVLARWNRLATGCAHFASSLRQFYLETVLGHFEPDSKAC